MHMLNERQIQENPWFIKDEPLLAGTFLNAYVERKTNTRKPVVYQRRAITGWSSVYSSGHQDSRIFFLLGIRNKLF